MATDKLSNGQMLGIAVLSGAAGFGSSHILQEEYAACEYVVEQAKKDERQDCRLDQLEKD